MGLPSTSALTRYYRQLFVASVDHPTPGELLPNLLFWSASSIISTFQRPVPVNVSSLSSQLDVQTVEAAFSRPPRAPFPSLVALHAATEHRIGYHPSTTVW